MSTKSMSPSRQLGGRHWTNLLRCPVCFSFFHDPVTLPCGHTFCKGCMRRLAEMIAGNHPEIPTERVRMWCPTCRQGVAARMFIRNDANISFVLQDLVEGWRAERDKLCTSGQVMVHSMSTQTSFSDNGQQKCDHVICETESYLKIRSDIQYLQAAILNTDSDFSAGDTNDNQHNFPRYSTSESAFEDINAIGNLGVEQESDNEEGEGHVQGNAQVEGQVERVLRRDDWSPSRTLMVIVWATYTLVIMLLAQNYLPYMFLYSVLFLMILYTERLPNRYVF